MIPLQTGSAACTGGRAAETDNSVSAAGEAESSPGSGTAVADGIDVDASDSEGRIFASSVSGAASAVGSGSAVTSGAGTGASLSGTSATSIRVAKETAKEAASPTVNCRETEMVILFGILKLKERILNLVKREVVVENTIKGGNGMPMDAQLRILTLRITDDQRITRIRMNILICPIQQVAPFSMALRDHCKTKIRI